MPSVAETRLLAFLNGATDPDILRERLDLSRSPALRLDDATARRVLTNRAALPEQSYADLEDVRAVLGHERLLRYLLRLFRIQPFTDRPVLLLPVRLETRFDGGRLLVRIYPDQIFVHTHEPALTSVELEAARVYDAAPEEKRRDAWRKLSAALGPTRAAWVARWAATHGASAGPTPRPADWTRAPSLGPLPDRFTVFAYRDGAEPKVAVGAVVRPNLSVVASPTRSAEQGLFDESSRWMHDFERALEVGLAVEIGLDAEDLEHGFSRVVAVGVKSTTAEGGRRRLEQLIDGHHYSAGFGFVARGSATNNTDRVTSPYVSREDHDAAFRTEIEGPPNWESQAAGERRTNAHRLADALGVDADVLRFTERSGSIGDSFAGEMNAVAWPATGGYYLRYLLAGAVPAAALDRIAAHVREFVRGGGPLPAIRVGRQPYGVLPVTRVLGAADAEDRWRPWTGDAATDAAFDAGLHGVVVGFFKQWLDYSRDPVRVPRVRPHDPDPDATLLRILAMEPNSITYRARPFVDDRFVAWLLAVLRDYVFGAGTPYEDAGTPLDWMRRWDEAYDALRARGAVLLEELTGRAAADLQDEPLLRTFGWWEGEDEPIVMVRDPENARLRPLMYLSGLCRRGATGARTLLAEIGRRSLRMESRRSAQAGARVRDALCRLSTASVLDFFNAVASPEQIVERIEDDPARDAFRDLEPPGAYGVRMSLARRILEERERLGGRFESIEQLDAVRGVGPDTLHDILYTFRDFEGRPNVDRLFRESIDIASHRVDAWATSFATKRLAGIRSDDTTERGIHLGAYGFVEDLKPQADDVLSEGYLHAPSAGHAATAAVLYNAYLTHDPAATKDDAGDARTANPFHINLTSERVRRASRILEGIRQGQPLGALLGYQFERALQDHAQPLEQFIDDFRERFPVVAHKVTDGSGAVEAVAARNVVDGTALVRDYRGEDGTSGHVAALLAAADGGRAALEEVIGVVDDALDAVGDLLVTEGVHQAVQGNYERGGAALEAASGNAMPPEIESVRTPVPGRTLTHRVCALFNETVAVDAAGPRGTAEPRIAKWFGDLLGDMSAIGLGFEFQELGPDGEPLERVNVNTADFATLEALPEVGDVLAGRIIAARDELPFVRIGELGRVDGIGETRLARLRRLVTTGFSTLGLDELGLSAADFLYIAQTPPEGGETELEQRVGRIVREEFALAADVRVEVLPGGPAGYTRGLDQAVELARHALTFAASGTALTPDTLCHPGDVDDAGYTALDADAMRARVEDALAALSAVEAELAANPFDPATAAARLLRAARYGLPGVIPPAADDEHYEARYANARAELARRRAACTRLLDEAAGAGDPTVAVRSLTDAMKALFGESFIVLPTFVPHRPSDLARALAQEDLVVAPADGSPQAEAAAAAATRARLRLWMQQVAEVRPRVAALEDIMMLEDAWTQATALGAAPGVRLRAAQLPFTPGRKWLGLDRDEGAEAEPAAGAALSPLSIVAAVAGPLPTLVDDTGDDGRVVLAGLLLDQWSEQIPADTVNTSVAFQLDSPNSQAPQSLLLAVPGEMTETPEVWTPLALAGIVNDTIDLAKVRAVDIDALAEMPTSDPSAVNDAGGAGDADGAGGVIGADADPIGAIAPGIYLPTDPDSPGWARDVATKTIAEWIDALAPDPDPSDPPQPPDTPDVRVDASFDMSEIVPEGAGWRNSASGIVLRPLVAGQSLDFALFELNASDRGTVVVSRGDGIEIALPHDVPRIDIKVGWRNEADRAMVVRDANGDVLDARTAAAVWESANPMWDSPLEVVQLRDGLVHVRLGAFHMYDYESSAPGIRSVEIAGVSVINRVTAYEYV